VIFIFHEQNCLSWFSSCTYFCISSFNVQGWHYTLLVGISTAIRWVSKLTNSLGRWKFSEFSFSEDTYNWSILWILTLIADSLSPSVRVSNTLGMSHPRAAKYSFYVAMFQSLLLGILFMTLIFLTKEDFATIFTNSEDMILAVADLAYLLGITMLLNSASQVISGECLMCLITSKKVHSVAYI